MVNFGREVMSATLFVPAKALLFGEYGVLYGGPALVATLDDLCFVFHMRLQEIKPSAANSGKPPVVTFESGMVRPQASFTADGQVVSESPDSAALSFLSRGLSSLQEPLRHIEAAGLCLRIHTEQEFSPDLGLGSSSAVVVGLVAFVRQAAEWVHGGSGGRTSAEDLESRSSHESQAMPELTPELWQALRNTLHACQGRGSGYDVAVQFLASQWMSAHSQGEPLHGGLEFAGHAVPRLLADAVSTHDSGGRGRRLWTFWPTAQPMEGSHYRVVRQQPAVTVVRGGIEVPRVREWPHHPFWQHSGWLLPSGQVAATAAILSRPVGKEEFFANQHASVALRALERLEERACWCTPGSPHPFAELFDESLEVAREQGIAEHVRSYGKLPQLHSMVAYKTMGAGYGDSLWAVARVLGCRVPDPRHMNDGRPILALESNKETTA